jgi:hypothetical protein|tara:strand:+ start:405 stop:599 length:195 start_codon:yes stop_codon:yes gene_type:complete
VGTLKLGSLPTALSDRRAMPLPNSHQNLIVNNSKNQDLSVSNYLDTEPGIAGRHLNQQQMPTQQ